MDMEKFSTVIRKGLTKSLEQNPVVFGCHKANLIHGRFHCFSNACQQGNAPFLSSAVCLDASAADQLREHISECRVLQRVMS